MADSAQDKTFEPTEHRLRKAREEGQLPQSKEVPSALMIAMLAIMMSAMASSMYGWFTSQAYSGFGFEYPGELNYEALRGRLFASGLNVMVTLAPFLIAGIAVSFFSSILVSGWAVCPKALKLKPDQLNPFTGFKKLFSTRNLMELLVSIAKMIIVSAVVWSYLGDKLPNLLNLRWDSPAGMMATTSRLILGVILRICIVLGVIALGDLMWQRWKHRRDMRMTMQDLKDERKQYEPAPEMKAKIRQIQMDMANKRMMQEVPAADVVVVNPTHIAVAIKYDADNMDAPQVVAKGPDLIAQKIKKIARENDVPIIHRPQIARALFATVEVGQSIPQQMFVAVAEILAMVFKMKNGK